MALVAGTWSEVLAHAWPGAEWSLQGDDLGTLVWYGPDQPSVAEIEAAAAGAWLELARARAVVLVDEQAEAERAMYITLGSGQAMVYLEKQREARAYINEADEDFPLLSTAVGLDLDPRTGQVITTMAQAAEVILLIAGQWAQAAAAIEERRLGAKRDCEAAADIAAVEAAMTAQGWQVP